MLHHDSIPWNTLALWIFLLRLQVPNLDICGVHDLWPGEHFRVNFDNPQIVFDISGTDKDQRLCLRSGLLEYTMALAVKHGFHYHPPWARNPAGRHLQLVAIEPPTKPFTRPVDVPAQRQALLNTPAGEVS